MDVSSQMLCGLLVAAWNKATEQANSLREQLLNEQGSATALVSAGSLSSVSKNTASQGYSHYGPGQVTQVQLVESYGHLIAAYDNCKYHVEVAFDDAAIEIPGDYDFDKPIYDLLTKILNSTADALVLPDITRLRLPRALPPSTGGVLC
jgi:hypothetical protein